MMKGGSNGDGKIRNVKRTSKRQRQIEDIFGEESEGAPSSCVACSMCGDVGFQDHLLYCCRCHERQEHSYCSSSYQELGANEASWVCDWCWPSLQRESNRSEINGQESVLCDGKDLRIQSISTSGTVRGTQNGLDLLLEVAWATADLKDLPLPLAKSMEKDFPRCTTMNGCTTSSPSCTGQVLKATGAVQSTDSEGTGNEVQRNTTGSPASLQSESSPSKPSSGSKRKQGLGSDKWSVTQKGVYSRNYEANCGRSGIQLERSNVGKGLGRRYRLLSSMLC